MHYQIGQTLAAAVLLLLGFQVSAQQAVRPAERKSLTIGETVSFHSEVLDEDRVLNIYLPNGYSPDSATVYPVIYLLDGSMDEDMLHIAGLVQFGSFSWINMVPASIVVGIANVNRQRDFTFPTDKKEYLEAVPAAGGSEAFINFIEQEVQPFVRENYKTGVVRTLIGQSLGGLLATEILFKKADLFDNYIIVSPSLWWDEESLLKVAPVPYPGEKSVYIGVGGEEGPVMRRTARELYDKLQALDREHTSLYYDFLEKEDHGNILHLAVYRAFGLVFKAASKQPGE
ncbi:MAG: alpha/beta hydrolase [Bacteroidetes bacterium]|nr:MAG: alpha/beta hydrolase [Bacteroidota bacterium]